MKTTEQGAEKMTRIEKVAREVKYKQCRSGAHEASTEELRSMLTGHPEATVRQAIQDELDERQSS